MDRDPVHEEEEGEREGEADWSTLLVEVVQLAVLDDQNALAMGDRLVRLLDYAGPELLRQVVSQSGLTWRTVLARSRVARAFPPGHPLRRLPLTFGHLHALAGTADPLGWGQRAVAGQWSADRLRQTLRPERAPGRRPPARRVRPDRHADDPFA